MLRGDDADVPLEGSVVIEGLAFGESPRWHEGRLWFVDFYDRAVWSVTGDDELCPELEIAGQPGGIGWLPDGRMLVASRTERRILRREHDGTVVEHADLSGIVAGDCNDMVVDDAGRAYVGEYGFDLYEWFGSGGGFDDAPTGSVVCVQPDGSASTVAREMRLPNGSVVTGDGVLIVAETFGACLTAFDIDPSTGLLSGRRVWAELPGRGPDGIAIDTDGAIWVADSRRPECVRVDPTGFVTDVVTTTQKCFACELGGPSRQTLYCLTATTSDQATSVAGRAGRLEVFHVGLPRPARTAS